MRADAQVLSHDDRRLTPAIFSVLHWCGHFITSSTEHLQCPALFHAIITGKVVSQKCGHRLFLTIHSVHKIHTVELLDSSHEQAISSILGAKSYMQVTSYSKEGWCPLALKLSRV